MAATPAPPPASGSYETFFGFAQAPFALTPDPRFLYRSTSHEEAIKQLTQALRRKEGFIVLTGDIGTGKTTIGRTLMQQLDPNTFTSLILTPFVTVEELLREVLMDFGVLSREAGRSGRAAMATAHELTTTLHDFLLSLVPIKGSAVLIIDEAQDLSQRVLEQIRVISNLETNETKLLQIVLVGQLNLLDALGEGEMRQLNQRVSQRATLRPLSGEEVEAYIGHRIWVARGASHVTFQSEAVDLVRQISGGVPRVINLLCDRALMAGAEAQEHDITPAHIRGAADALGLQAPAPARARRPRGRRLARAAATLALALAPIAVIAGVLVVRPLGTWVDAHMPEAAPAPARRVPPPVEAVPIPEDATAAFAPANAPAAEPPEP